MLGEVTSESARAPSPWDELLRTPTPPFASIPSELSPSSLPKLVPEVEEGSVEYKLKLLDPTPARFARLVTQLKWRLLEGHGQAYYEIGVADSGLLIGLTKHDLEKSLETLEEMASEIGASVIVVKEVEVPEDLVRLAEQSEQFTLLAYPSNGEEEEEEVPEPLVSRLGSWDRRSKRQPISSSLGSLTSVSTMSTDNSTETDTLTTNQEEGIAAPNDSALDPDISALTTIANASLDMDSDRAVFTMDLDLDPEHAPSPPVVVAPPPLGLLTHAHAVDLSISSVFKLRPHRHRHTHPHTKADRRQAKWEKREKKVKTDWVSVVHGHHRHSNPHVPNNKKRGRDEAPPLTDGTLTKAEKRRMARDARREEKKRVLVTTAPQSTSPVHSPVDILALDVKKQVNELVHALEGMHVGIATASGAVEPTHVPKIGDQEHAAVKRTNGVHGHNMLQREARHILEVLVVKKMSMEEAYGDFGFEGFEVE